MSELRKFFVVGTGRSGTTLLQAMLMSSPGVYIPPETQYMGMIWRYRARYGDLQHDENWRLAITRIERMTEHREMNLDLDRFAEALENCERSHASLFGVWLDEIAMSEGVTCIGEKSPVHAQYVTELLSMFPEASIVHIVRDPRDVVTSQKELWFRNALHVAVGWRQDAEAAIRFGQLLDSERYSVIRYEDLVTDPESVLRPLCDRLQIVFDDRMLTPHTREKKGLSKGMEHVRRTLEPVTAKRIGRWTTKLSKVDVAVVELMCQRSMKQFGYEPSGASRALGVLGVCYQAPVGIVRRAFMRRRRKKIEFELRGGRDTNNPSPPVVCTVGTSTPDQDS